MNISADQNQIDITSNNRKETTETYNEENDMGNLTP